MNSASPDREVCERATRREPDAIRDLTRRFSTLLAPDWSVAARGSRGDADELLSSVAVTFATGYLESCDREARPLNDYVDSLVIPDLLIATACLLGDEAASRKVLELVETRVRPSLLKHWADRIPRQHVDDVLQDLISHCVTGRGSDSTMASSRLASYRGRATLTTWLYAIVAKQLLDVLRSARAKRSRPLLEETVASSAAAIRPDVQIEGAEENDRGRMHRDRLVEVLRDAVDMMPPRRRLAAVLRWVRGHRPAEVADRMRISRPRVSELLTEADRDFRNATRPVCTQIAMELDKPVAEIEGILSDQLQHLLNETEESTDGEDLTLHSPQPSTSNEQS
jgi:RNA polymerase sigma factor (sigma-70 family)